MSDQHEHPGPAALHEYAFDVELACAIRVKAGTEKEARTKLREFLDCADANFGELDGTTITAEVSALASENAEDSFTLYEVDGEPA